MSHDTPVSFTARGSKLGYHAFTMLCKSPIVEGETYTLKKMESEFPPAANKFICNMPRILYKIAHLFQFTDELSTLFHL